jgi:hypothetical protein
LALAYSSEKVMSWDQYAHPEFGFFCPTPRLRRELRIAFVSILFGAIGGAAGVVALSAGHRDADSRTIASMVTANTAIGLPSSNRDATSPGTQSYSGLEGGLKTSHSVKADDEATKGDTAAADDKTIAAKTAACQDYASGYMSGPCLADRPRRLRVRAGTDGPEVARLPLGRTAVTSGGELANSPDGPAEGLHSLAQDNATAATPPRSENSTQDRAHFSGAPPKKPQKTARNQNRHRNEPGDHYRWREDRADQRVDRIDTNIRDGRFGHISARDGSYARQGFWDWSR